MARDFIMILRMAYEIVGFRNFPFNIFGLGWPQVPETAESKTVDKEGLLIVSEELVTPGGVSREMEF